MQQTLSTVTGGRVDDGVVKGYVVGLIIEDGPEVEFSSKFDKLECNVS